MGIRTMFIINSLIFLLQIFVDYFYFRRLSKPKLKLEINSIYRLSVHNLHFVAMDLEETARKKNRNRFTDTRSFLFKNNSF